VTIQEQASLEALRVEVNAGFAEMRQLMESRRVEEVRVQEQLERRILAVEAAKTSDVARKEVVSAFFNFGKYVVTTAVAMAGLYLLTR